MMIIKHVFLRGKVYWWRRRLPNTDQDARAIRIELSLRTKSLARVKKIAPEITALSNTFRMSILDRTMSPMELKQALVAKVSSLTGHKPAIREHERSPTKPGNDYATDWALKLYLAENCTEQTATEEIKRFLRATHETEIFDAVAVRLSFLKRIHFRQYKDRPGELLCNGSDDRKRLKTNFPGDAIEPRERSELDGCTTLISSESDVSLLRVIARAAAEKVATHEWTQKTAKQHVKLASLFVKFVGHDDPRRMDQWHIANFRSVLIRLPKNYGKSPRDAGLSINDLVSKSQESNGVHNGLSSTTINRHMTQLANIVGLCNHAGVPFSRYHGVRGLRIRRSNSPRSQRGKFSTAEIESIFALPIWQGCIGRLERFTPGPEVIHDALYWVPLLAAYTGARRAELCDLLASDIRFSEHHNLYFMDIGPREHRRLKNIQSQRQVPIHQELIRLGFITYVEALRRQGFLFPDLRRGSGKTSAGDVFDKSWQKIRAASLPNAKVENKVFHSFRHWCNNEMKQGGVPAEVRKDLLGHTNSGVNEGRYTEAARLGVMADAVQRLPTPSGSMRLFPINLSLD